MLLVKTIAAAFGAEMHDDGNESRNVVKGEADLARLQMGHSMPLGIGYEHKG